MLFILLPPQIYHCSDCNPSFYRSIRILSIRPQSKRTHYLSIRCITTIMSFEPSNVHNNQDPVTFPPTRVTQSRHFEGIEMPGFIKDEKVSCPMHTPHADRINITYSYAKAQLHRTHWLGSILSKLISTTSPLGTVSRTDTLLRLFT
jgi:hypothetical protein